MFHWKFHGEILSFGCCNLGHCVISWFWSILGVLFFLSWCNLEIIGSSWNFGNVGKLWCCWMNFGLDFGSIGIVKNLCCRLRWICSWCIWEKFVGMCKLCFMEMKFWLWKNFVGYVMLVHGKFVWLWFWLCENLFVHGHELVGNFYGDLGHVVIFCAWLWKKKKKKFGSCVWICERFWLWRNFGGSLIFENFFGHVGFKCGVFLDMRFWSWKIFGHVILGHGNFLSCESFSFLFLLWEMMS